LGTAKLLEKRFFSDREVLMNRMQAERATANRKVRGGSSKKRRARRGPRGWTNEEGLVDLLKGRDQEALRLIMLTYRDRLFAVANRICNNPADAEEVVQDVFITALDKIHRFEGRSTLSTWLYRIAVNTALMKLRNQRLVHRNSVPMDDANESLVEKERGPSPFGKVRSPDEAFLSMELCEEIGRTLDGLPDVYREVFLLRGIHGLSTKEAGELLDVSPAAIKSRLHRSRDLIRERLHPYLD
jgi:RNA polymerase sigma-70 factor (ECF subfamily)